MTNDLVPACSLAAAPLRPAAPRFRWRGPVTSVLAAVVTAMLVACKEAEGGNDFKQPRKKQKVAK